MADIVDLPPVARRDGRRKKRKGEPKQSSRCDRLRSLKCFDKVHSMIVNGFPFPEIAEFIQGTAGEAKTLQRSYLIDLLGAYRRSLPPATLVAKMPPVFEKAAQEVREGLDVLAEMERLFRLQIQRINIDHSNELKARKLFPTMTAEIKTAKDLLESYQKVLHDLGLSERHLGTLHVQAATEEVLTRYGKPAVRQTLEDPRSKRRLLSVVERLVKINTAREDMDAEDMDAEEVEVEEVEAEAGQLEAETDSDDTK